MFCKYKYIMMETGNLDLKKLTAVFCDDFKNFESKERNIIWIVYF